MKRKHPLVEPPLSDEGELRQLLAWLVPVCFAFALLAVVASVAFRDYTNLLTGIILFCYGCLVLVARAQVQRHEGQRAIWIICVSLLVGTIILGAVRPSLYPTLIVTPLLAVMMAVPYVSRRTLSYLIVAGLAVIVAISSLKQAIYSPPSRPPHWFENVFSISSLVAAIATVLLLLWQYRNRLTHMLTQTREAEERYALAAQAANDGLWDWNLTTDQMYYSPRWKAIIGCNEEEIGTDPEDWFDRIHPADRENVRSRLKAHLDGTADSFESEHRIVVEDGKYRWVLARGMATRNPDGVATRIAGSLADITERKHAEQQLLHNALHDALTDLPNRALFMDRLKDVMKQARRSNDRSFAVLFLDLDRFKNLNDSLGHTLGDSLLKTVASRLERCLRSGYTVARLGGDEFAVLANQVDDAEDAVRVANRIQEALKKPTTLRGYVLFTTASIGIALGAGGENPEDLLRDADTAMYRAKVKGRGRWQVFDGEMHDNAMALLNLEMGLRQAIESGEFELYYQPIVSLKTGVIAGAEALLRWSRPHRGLALPDSFMPVLEDTGLIRPLGWSMLREACNQVLVWDNLFRDHPPLTLSVNFSASQIAQDDFVEQLSDTLRDTGLDASRLRVEITENVIMQDVDFAAGVLARLRELNVQVHIDDFGTGYSSLSALHRFPIDALKIDRLFMEMSDADRENTEVVQTMVTLAHNLGMDVIAEGVENDSQLEYLQTLGCDYAQGHYFCEPTSGLQDIQALIAREPQF
ncbi:MAG: EAL domain-containing protein [Actinomycetota bacterium]|nr:EAL domain-containing protein [Actinomycetota bacterium]